MTGISPASFSGHAAALVAVLAALSFVGCSGSNLVSAETARSTVTVTAISTVPTASTPTPVTPTTTPTMTPQPTATSLSIADAAELVKQYTVLVWITDARGRVLGNGSGISLGVGEVLTNNHVVERAAQVWVRFADGRQDAVRVQRVDRRRDLALLKSSFTNEPSAEIGDSRAVRSADSLLAVGYPRADAIGARDVTVTRGIFSGLRQTDGVWHVQTDTSVNPGNSGGPLADSQGRVIGVVRRMVRDAVGLNFAIASDEVRAFLEGVPPEAPPDPRPAATPGVQQSRTVASPKNVWTVILHGDLQSEAEASARARTAVADFRDAGVIFSSDYPSLRPGFWVVYAGQYGTEATAAVAATGARDKGYAGAYSRWLGEEGASPTATLQPSVLAPAGPPDAVRQFYTHIGARDFRAAWSLLGPTFRSKNQYDGWVKGYESTRSVQTTAVTATSQTREKATVDVTVVSQDTLGSQQVTKTFQGTWDLVLVDGSWKLDIPNMRQINSS